MVKVGLQCLCTKGQVLKVLCALQPFWHPSAVPWLAGSRDQAQRQIKFWRLPQRQQGVQQGQKAIQVYALSMWKPAVNFQFDLAAPASETCCSLGISWNSWNSISWQTVLSLTCDPHGFQCKTALARATLMVRKRGCKSLACGLRGGKSGLSVKLGNRLTRRPCKGDKFEIEVSRLRDKQLVFVRLVEKCLQHGHPCGLAGVWLKFNHLHFACAVSQFRSWSAQKIKGPDNPTRQLLPIMSTTCCSGDRERRKDKGGGGGSRSKTKLRVWQSCMWKMVCDKERWHACDKVVCKRWCVCVCVSVCVCVERLNRRKISTLFYLSPFQRRGAQHFTGTVSDEATSEMGYPAWPAGRTCISMSENLHADFLQFFPHLPGEGC